MQHLDHALLQIARPGRDHRHRPPRNRPRDGLRAHHPRESSRRRLSPPTGRAISPCNSPTQHGWETGAMDLKESASERKKARRDYSLEWEARPGDPRNVDETRWRVHSRHQRRPVDSARGFWKLPGDLRARARTGKRARHRDHGNQNRGLRGPDRVRHVAPDSGHAQRHRAAGGASSAWRSRPRWPSRSRPCSTPA